MLRSRLHVVTLLLLILAFPFVTRAQQMTPRIAGLERNEEYMSLLREELRLQAQEDSVVQVVSGLRRQFREESAIGRRDIGRRLVESEERIFGIRGARGVLMDRITAIEQEWVLSHLDAPVSDGASDTSAVGNASGQLRNLIYNDYFAEELPPADYAALRRAQELELTAVEYVNRYHASYRRLSRLAREYETATGEEQADSLYTLCRRLIAANDALSDSLVSVWNYIYDNKSYAYAYLLEKLGQYDILAHEEELYGRATREISELRGQTASDAVVDYFLRKPVVIDYESKLAGLLNLDAALDSLRGVTAQLRLVDCRLPRIEPEERYFLDLAPIVYSSRPVYSYQNPIPECRVHPHGTIYRLLLGTFNTKRAAAVFRGASPLFYLVDEEGKWRYFAGGFATRVEADKAQQEAKAHGFVRPEVVVWRDGVYRNLTRDPEQTKCSYRVELEGELSDAARAAIAEKAGGCELSRTGEGRFVLGLFDEEQIASGVADAIRAADPTLVVRVTEFIEIVE